MVGRPKYPEFMTSMKSDSKKDVFIGDDCQVKMGILDVTYPIVQGVVVNFDDMEMIWRYAYYNELEVAPENHPTVLTEVPFNPKANKERITTIMFEQFNIPALHIIKKPVLAIYATGRTTGICLHCGEYLSHVTPVIEGYFISRAMSKTNIGGNDITNYLGILLSKKGYNVSASNPYDHAILQNMKETLGYICGDFESQIELSKEKPSIFYEMPNGDVTVLGDERFRCTEVLFNPKLIGNADDDGIDVSILKSIYHCQISNLENASCNKSDVCSLLSNNIVLSGGTTLFQGMGNRLKREILLKHNAPNNYVSNNNNKIEISVLSPKNREHLVWTGGSLIASLATFQHMWLLKKDFDKK
mmetsp:Transcript_55715/g.65103  ORF Transcript_55715/g.65103 Transcript_55715/m.65103 type:complete len:358 (+) Transcript_55715:105-1178(+)